MAERSQKQRPNEVGTDLSDERSGKVLDASRTQQRVVGYARVSPADRSVGPDGQHRALRAAGAERVFVEWATCTSPRPTLAAAIASLGPGDVLVVATPDRLARTTAELLEIAADLAQRGIGLVILSIGGARLDTREPASKRMLDTLAGVAAWQREAVLERRREGIAKAKAAGKYRGRPVSIDRTQVRQLRAELGPAAIAKKLGIARSSVYRLLPR
jgi:DNA invertase Pin-like site-specific DNA recombinase